MLLDLDHFRRYNEQFGHTAGDAALKAVALAFKQAVRETDLAERLRASIADVNPGLSGADALVAHALEAPHCAKAGGRNQFAQAVLLALAA